jgi:hypothetical protein
MTDPLSITLAVITLATALKDIIETASAIQDSFSKVVISLIVAMVFQILIVSQSIATAELSKCPETRKVGVQDLARDARYLSKETCDF